MLDWELKKISEIAEFNPQESIKKGQLAKKIAMEKLIPYCKQIPSYELCNFNGGTKFRNEDTIMARITPCLENGKISKVNILDDEEVGFGSTEYIIFRAIKGKADPDFLYYLITSPLIKEPAIKSMVGSSGRQRVQTDVVKNIDVKVPPLKIQQKIGRILSVLDDKISINNATNNNLEQQAQAIFKSWFVDVSDSNNSSEKFGKFPQLATELTVGDIEMLVTDYVANGSFASLKENVTLYQEPNYAYFVRNTDLKTNTFNVFVDEHSYKFLSKSTLYGNEIIISNVGDVGSVFLCPNLDLPMTLGNNIIMLRPKDNRLTYYLYIWFKWSYGQNLMQGIKGGSAQPKFNKTDFKSLPIIIPQGKLLDKFSDIMTPIFNSIEKNNKENKFLIQLRDTLLPKLMSGEIDVSNVDISIDKLLLNEG